MNRYWYVLLGLTGSAVIVAIFLSVFLSRNKKTSLENEIRNTSIDVWNTTMISAMATDTDNSIRYTTNMDNKGQVSTSNGMGKLGNPTTSNNQYAQVSTLNNIPETTQSMTNVMISNRYSTISDSANQRLKTVGIAASTPSAGGNQMTTIQSQLVTDTNHQLFQTTGVLDLRQQLTTTITNALATGSTMQSADSQTSNTQKTSAGSSQQPSATIIINSLLSTIKAMSTSYIDSQSSSTVIRSSTTMVPSMRGSSGSSIYSTVNSDIQQEISTNLITDSTLSKDTSQTAAITAQIQTSTNQNSLQTTSIPGSEGQLTTTIIATTIVMTTAATTTNLVNQMTSIDSSKSTIPNVAIVETTSINRKATTTVLNVIITTVQADVLTTGRMDTSTVNQPVYWTPDASLNVRRSDFGAGLLANGQIIITGGKGSLASEISSTEFYSLPSGWSVGPAMKANRELHGFTLFANNMKALATGNLNVPNRQTAEVYDSATNTWTSTSKNMLSGRYAHVAILLGNGRILIAGGRNTSTTCLSAAEIYIPSSDSFTSINSMNLPRALSAGTLLRDGSTILVTGGLIGASTATPTAELYTGGSWVFTNNNMSEYRTTHAAVLLNDGNVLIAGGGNGSGAALSSAEIFNITTRTFTVVGSMKYRRGYFTLTLLPSGKVLATGGLTRPENTYPVVSELYDPLTRSWSDAAILNNGRSNHQTILLNDSVLTIGGINTATGALTSCERYYF